MNIEVFAWRYSKKITVLKDFTKFMLTPVVEASFQKSRGPRAYKSIKKEIYQGCFPIILEEFGLL